MRFLHEYKRRSILPLAGLALAAYYLVVLAPLSRRAEELDAPLRNAWQKLSAALEQTNVFAIDFLHITNQLAETRQAIALLENGKQKAAARLELSPSVRSNMSAPFQLVVYQDERSQQMDDLARLAKQNQVTIDPAVFTGFPEHTAETRQPALLWAALSLVQSLLSTALQCKVGVIHSLDVPLVLTNAPPTNAPLPVAEIPLQVELTGSAGSLLRLLQYLPLRPEEARASGLPEVRPDKAPLFIDGLILRKQSPDKPDEVRVALRAVGFVLRE
jgi:hypothetical protein